MSIEKFHQPSMEPAEDPNPPKKETKLMTFGELRKHMETRGTILPGEDDIVTEGQELTDDTHRLPGKTEDSV